MGAGHVKLNNHQVGRAGEHFVAAEIHRRGGYAVTFSGNMPGIDILASNPEQTRRIAIQVKTKGTGSAAWQTTIAHGRPTEAVPELEAVDRYWVLVDLRAAYPEFYVMPEWWIRNDIYTAHQAYLARHGGVRPGKNPESLHHAVQPVRVAEWKGQWSTLGILPSPWGDDDPDNR